MTYFADFSSYSYLGNCKDSSANIGWLDSSMSFPQGETSEEFQQKLFQFCTGEILFFQTRGWHQCNLGNCPYPVRIGKYNFGDAEIRVIGRLSTYASPNLIFHYISVHKYKPPDEFIDAVLKSPHPDAKPYQKLRIQLDPPFVLKGFNRK